MAANRTQAISDASKRPPPTAQLTRDAPSTHASQRTSLPDYFKLATSKKLLHFHTCKHEAGPSTPERRAGRSNPATTGPAVAQLPGALRKPDRQLPSPGKQGCVAPNSSASSHGLFQMTRLKAFNASHPGKPSHFANSEGSWGARKNEGTLGAKRPLKCKQLELLNLGSPLPRAQTRLLERCHRHRTPCILQRRTRQSKPGTPDSHLDGNLARTGQAFLYSPAGTDHVARAPPTSPIAP